MNLYEQYKIINDELDINQILVKNNKNDILRFSIDAEGCNLAYEVNVDMFDVREVIRQSIKKALGIDAEKAGIKTVTPGHVPKD